MSSTADRERWNARYRAGEEGRTPLMLGRSLHHFPRSGRALDLAGGPGQAAVILAARGMSVTLTDISEVALDLAVSPATWGMRCAGDGAGPISAELDINSECTYIRSYGVVGEVAPDPEVGAPLPER